MVQIGDAHTVDDIDRIGRELSAVKTLSPQSKKLLREAFTARRRTLRATGATHQEAS
jgi:hypothetical protein